MNAHAQAIRIPAVPLFIVLPIIGFLVPLCIPAPQIVVGVIVNALLVFYALRLPSKPYALMCMMPSIGAIGNGMIFGTGTPFLLYFIPSIWVGNMVFIFSIQRLTHTSLFVRVGIAAMLKAAILFLTAYIFIQLHLAPKIFLGVMGSMQLMTALIGGYIATIVHKRI